MLCQGRCQFSLEYDRGDDDDDDDDGDEDEDENADDCGDDDVDEKEEEDNYHHSATIRSFHLLILNTSISSKHLKTH